MTFFRFLFAETKKTNILLAALLITFLNIFLPENIQKDMPSLLELIYFIPIFFIVSLSGYFFAKMQDKLDVISPVFDQASSVVILLAILIIPICLINPKSFSILLLIFIVELGVMTGKFLYIKK